MIVITDLLKKPIDEGAKVTTFNILSQLNVDNRHNIISINGDYSFEGKTKLFNINKGLLNLKFYKYLKKNTNKKVLYIPEASITLASFIRAKLIHFFSNKQIFILALQPRDYSFLIKKIIFILQPECIISLSKKMSKNLSKLGIKNKRLPIGVDSNKFFEYTASSKKKLRELYKIKQNKTVLLHVGHIKTSRNLEWLIETKKINPDLEILIVGSTYNKADKSLYERILKNNIKIIQGYIPNIVDIYNIADYYIFPVLKNEGAIETPLSVLEAMACNIPVITSNFGSLPDFFKSNEDLQFVSSAQDICKNISLQRTSACKNRKKIEPFTWKKIVCKLLDIVEK